MDSADLHRRLTRLMEKTKSAENLDAGGWWVGDVAGERVTLDDAAAGRIHWKAAHRAARQGIEALDTGNQELALDLAWVANDYYVAALEIRVRPSDLEKLGRQPQRRGRRKKIT